MNPALDDSLKVSMIFSEPSQDWLPASCWSPEAVARPIRDLMNYVKAHVYEGADPLDGLSSPLLPVMPLGRTPFMQHWFHHLCKTSATNWRPLLFTPRHFSPLAGAGFLQGYVDLLSLPNEDHTDERYENEAYILFQRLKHERLPRGSGSAWGNPFPWMTRAFTVPAKTPDLVTSVGVGHALLSYYERFQDNEALSMAIGVGDFLRHEMIRTQTDPGFLCFRYIPGQENKMPPGQDFQLHSANLTGAAYLARLLPYLAPEIMESVKERVLEAMRFSLSDIGDDGSWPIGTDLHHREISPYHTAVCIESLLSIYRILQQSELLPILQLVTRYFLFHLFQEDGQLMPEPGTRTIDSQTLAQCIHTVRRLREQHLWIHPGRLVQVESGLLALLQRFQSPKIGFIYHSLNATTQKWNRIPYMRGGQAPMFRALTYCLKPE